MKGRIIRVGRGLRDKHRQADRLDPAAHDAFLRRALEEDRATEDVTRAILVPDERSAIAELTVKAPGVICGLDLAAPVFRLLDPNARVTLLAGSLASKQRKAFEHDDRYMDFTQHRTSTCGIGQCAVFERAG